MLKQLADGVATVLVAPLLLLYRAQSAIVPTRRVQAFQGCGQLLSMAPGLPGVYMRRAFYRRTAAGCSRDCSIGFLTLLTHPGVTIGRHVYIGARCTIGNAAIGDDVLIGSNVDVLSGKHQHNFDRVDVPVRLQGGRYDRISIGRDVWIGNSTCIIADVGEQAVVAAGAVVVKPVAPRTIVGGNPAKVIGTRGREASATDLPPLQLEESRVD